MTSNADEADITGRASSFEIIELMMSIQLMGGHANYMLIKYWFLTVHRYES